MKKIEKLIIYGRKLEASAKEGEVIYELESSNRGEDNKHPIDISGDDKQLELVFGEGENKTTWLCDAATLHEIYPEMDAAVSNKAGARSADLGEGFELPSSLAAPGGERGLFGSIVLKLLKVITKKTVEGGLIKLAKNLEDKHLKNGIPDNSTVWANGFEKKYIEDGAGLFRIDKDFNFSIFDSANALSSNPFFLFIHGTNSDTKGAFEELAKSQQVWATLHNKYGENVIAFQHRTLSESPLENAVKLANMLPDKVNLHIISHSRGGIVGDILCKYSGADPAGFSGENIALLTKETGREKDIENIRELNKIFKTKKITVTRFLRVACPAAGTKLASKRLDHILNAFFNLLGGSANLFADPFKELLSEAVSKKDDTKVLPGVEAQNPDSPFIKILNDQSDAAAIDGSSLAVISGNGSISISGNGLLVILAKLFYQKKNDLVVDTDSMYLGVKRKNNIQYFFDQDANVNHVKYFTNTKTREAINIALGTPETALIPGFKVIAQNEIPGTDRGERALEYGELYPDKEPPSGKKPIVVLLPGIMGSNLEKSGSKIWLNYLSSVAGGLTKLEYIADAGIAATSLIKTSYKKLATRLSNNYDVVIYPYDWRKQLNECAKEFDVKIKQLMQYGQPIKIIGHSMGGVLVRDFIINHDDTWKKLNNSKGFRLLFLGSPLGGSYRIPTVLFGQDAIINSLSKLDMVHTKKELVQMFSTFPGILSLLPIKADGDKNDFSKTATWETMRDVFGDSKWPIPGKNELTEFENYQKNIIAKRDSIDFSNMVYIAGQDKQTPCSYYNDDIPPRKELVFLYTGEGDQSVTWDSGIPKQLAEHKDKNKVYYVPVTHGALANEPAIFDGIEEILENGFTGLLNTKRPVLRGEEKLFRGTAEVNFDLSETGLENAVFGIDDKTDPIISQVPLTVSVSNGDLAYSSYPLLAGHFLSDGILYAEKTIDKNLNRMLSNMHQLGLYPGEIGSNDIFDSSLDGDFPGAIIVGLGEPGTLTSGELAKTVEQGISYYLLSIKEKARNTSETKIGISALLVGCGYGGLSVETSIKTIIEGVNNANSKAISLFQNNCKIIQHVEFVEIYLDKALSCMYVLNKIASRENFSYNISIRDKKIKNLLGLKKRLPMDLSEDWWNRVTVKFKPAKENTAGIPSMIFGAATGEAREEEKELYSSTPLIDVFISEISTKNQWSPSSAKTLFELMIPNDFKDKLKRKGNITWVLDNSTAAYPWELLQDNTKANAKPLCINAGMIRQLAISDYRINIKRVSSEKALVVADPPLNGFINQLPGAVVEGNAVVEILNNNGYANNALIGKDASSIVRNLFAEEYSIIHLAGHGVANPDSPKKSGMVIGKDLFLTVFDIEQMTVIPELVFVNCCHLGKINPGEEKFYSERYKLAANIGTELIRIGVKAVIAAGWAVNDDAAMDFAKQFYNAMFAGENFGDAVKKARTFVYEHHKVTNTWGAYQCYGDPFYKFKKATRGKKSWEPTYLVPEEAELDLENMLNELQMGKGTIIESLDKLEIISKAVDTANIRNAIITEKEALIYMEMVQYEKAVDRFESLLQRENAAFSFFCLEKYCNARAKLCVSDFFKDTYTSSSKKKQPVNFAAEIDRVIDNMVTLLGVGPTAERLNLTGSTYKRKAMLVEDTEARSIAYKSAAFCYNEAGKVYENENKIYSIINAIEIEAILILSGLAKWGEKVISDLILNNDKKFNIRTSAEAKTQLEELVKNLKKNQGKDSLYYWDMVASTNIDLCLLLINDKKSAGKNEWDEIAGNYRKIWKKAGSPGKKIAELEHLQFLIYALAKAKSSHKISDLKHLNIDSDYSEEKLTAMIEQLRLVYNDITPVEVTEKFTRRKPIPANKVIKKKAAKK